MSDRRRASRDEIETTAFLVRGADPVESAYRVLDEVAARFGLQDAWLVLHPLGLCPQVFRHGGGPIDGADVRRLAAQPTGLYGEPAIEPALGSLLGTLCEAVFTACAAAGDARIAPTGLLSRRAIDASLTRAAACAARHRWSTTAVLVTTAGAGEAAERWPALAAALGEALRSGDEAGVIAPGTALALLGNAGADAVRPFLARVRATLSASGWDDTDLLAAPATTPQESVDPSELWRLMTERLAELGGSPPAPAAGPALELELRLLPSVAFVAASENGSGPELTVVRLAGDDVQVDDVQVDDVRADDVRADIDATVRRHQPGLTVQVVTTEAPTAPGSAPMPVGPLGAGAVKTNGTNGHHQSFVPSSTSQTVPLATAPTIDLTLARAVTAPGTGPGPGQPRRVTLTSASFDPHRGMSEVALALGPARGTGRAPAGALVGGAQATLVALGALGRNIPFYLVSAERARAIPGEPVVVVLASRDDDADGASAAERIGVASGTTDVEAAARAVLAALNRFLTGPRTTA